MPPKYSKECEKCLYYQGIAVYCTNPCLQCPHFMKVFRRGDESDKKKDNDKKKKTFPWIK